MTEPNYLVRQYRPSYCSGFDDAVFKGVPRDKLTALPWFRNFEHHHSGGFDKFVIEPYPPGDELIISAYYNNGEHWVAGFALPENSESMSNNGDLMRDNWRYSGAVEFKL